MDRYGRTFASVVGRIRRSTVSFTELRFVEHLHRVANYIKGEQGSTLRVARLFLAVGCLFLLMTLTLSTAAVTFSCTWSASCLSNETGLIRAQNLSGGISNAHVQYMQTMWVELFGLDSNDLSGLHVALGDVNNDGRIDVILGSNNIEGPGDTCPGINGVNCGGAHIYYGPDFSVGAWWNSTPDVEIIGLDAGDGARVAHTGDVDNDGIADVILGASASEDVGNTCPGNDGTSCGSVQIYFGINSSAAESWNTTPDLELFGLDSGDFAGANALLIADINADDFLDILLVASSAENTSNTCPGADGTSCGSVQIYLNPGVAGSWNTTPDLELFGYDTGDGATSVGVGDVDNDGFADVVLGSGGAEDSGDTCPGANGQGCGAAFVYYGPNVSSAETWNTTPDVHLYGRDAGDNAGGTMAIGDVDGDGIDDILLGAANAEDAGNTCPGADGTGCGSVQIYYGINSSAAESWNTTPDLELFGLDSNDLAGLGAYSDINGDGFSDIVLASGSMEGAGDTCADTDGTDCGGVQIYFNPGPSGSWNTTPDVELLGRDAGDAGGRIAVGDVNDDGISDIVYGATGAEDVGNTCPGTDGLPCGAGQIYLGTGDRYANTLCCSTDVNHTLDNLCLNASAIPLISLSAAHDAHAQDPAVASYSVNACMALTPSSGLACTYKNTTCAANETGILSMASSEVNGGLYNQTNAHVANYTTYTLNLCCIVDNTPPTVPVLLYPLNNNYTVFERNITFDWQDSTDLDGDPILYDWNLTTATCPDMNQSGLSPSQYTSSELCIDEVYNWTVRACDQLACSAWASPFNFTIASVVGITFTVNNTDFGVMSNDQTDNTTDDTPPPFLVENTGNVIINVTIKADDDLFQTSALGNDTFQFKGRENETGSYDATQVNFTNFTVSFQNLFTNLSHMDGNDAAFIDVLVLIPSGEGAGARESIINLTGVSVE